MTNGVGDRGEHASDDEFGLGALREVLRLISETDITEIKIERGGSKLHIRRGQSQAPHAAAAPFLVTPSLAAAMPQHHLHSPLPPVAPFHQHGTIAHAASDAPAPELGESLPAGEPITAPMVGTFYNAPSPKDPAYIQEGDIIQPGDRVGIVEAMKMMNEIEAEIGGRVARILVKNGQPVEYGQPLMIVEPL
ncbi:MAG TPA: acetyl-CoA carboxylase biotin carboxyl carrier protein [Kouleothrix sp.]|uniref:acetyl-CoA carboxylase biotin carboxyl carrier protein n=1 Tax=Kouleothrix sp. TaxID=2779161 RepID=UPI002C788991|nr:acetyl-CoA carboxylase biotin carboxyl carrier protein [Kouleothrix sp.]HRC77166.1 acetyl-CoA carboxylase biotin carboxyl carrier protein [Kouleothrix sp.]